MADESGGSTKSIRIKFEIDQQSFTTVKRAVDDLATSFKSINTAANGLGGGGFANLSVGGAAPSKQQQIQNATKGTNAPSIGAPSMSKVILENANAFKKFALDGKESSKIMTEALRRDMVEQERSLERLKGKLKSISEEYEEATKAQKDFLAAGKTSQAGLMGARANQMQGQISATSGQILQTTSQINQAQQVLAGAAPPNTGGFLQKIGMTGTGFEGGLPGFIRGIGTAVAGALSATKFGLDEYQAGGGDGGQGGLAVRAKARRGSVLEGQIRAARAGDTTQQALMSYIQSDKDARSYFAQSTNLISELDANAKGVATGIRNLPVLSSFLGTNQGVLENLSDAQIQNMLLEGQERRKAEVAASTGFLEKRMAREYLHGTMGSRTSASLMTGATTYQQFDKNGKKIGVTFADQEDWATRNGLGSADQFRSNTVALRQRLGSRGTAFAGNVTLAQAAGWGGVESLMGSAYQGAASVEQARILARGAIGSTGRGAEGAGIELGSLLFGYNSRGTTSGQGLLSAITESSFNGLDQMQTFNKVKDIGQALRFGDTMSTGSIDAFQRAANVIDSARILGKNTSNRAIDYLANGMDFKQMVDIGFGSGRMTAELGTYGLSRGQVKEAASSKLLRLLQPETSDTSEAGRAARAAVSALQAGGDFRQYWQKLSATEKRDLGVAMGNRTGAGGQIGTSLAEIFGGLGATDLKSGMVGGRLDAITKAEANRAADEKRRLEANLPMEEKELTDQISATSREAEAKTRFGENLAGKAEDLGEAMLKLTEAMKKAMDRISESDKQNIQFRKASHPNPTDDGKARPWNKGF